MKKTEELSTYLRDNNVRFFKSKKPGVFCLDGKHKSEIQKIIFKISNNELQCWESLYNGKWTTFVKNPNKAMKNEYQETRHYVNEYDDVPELYEAFDYDEVSCDPDLKEHWDSTYGAGDVC